MHIFQDKTGREWEISITVEAVKRVRSMCAINLLDAIRITDKDVNADLITQLAEDPVLLVDVLWALCRTQAESRGVKPEDFGEAMDGETVEKATDALLQDLCDFFPAAKRRFLRTVLASASRIKQQSEAAAQAFLDSGELERELSKQEITASSSFTSLPESQA